MNLSMYKPDEGYWTRMISAIGWGLIGAWFAVYLWDQASAWPLPEGVEPQLVQGAVGGVTLLLAGAFVYWMVYIRKPSSEFLIATDSEMKKVNWSTRREVLGSTWVVIGISLLLAVCLFVVDFLFSQFFRSIGVLET